MTSANRMIRYPNLSTTAQQGLPKLTQTPIEIPAKFADSTHQLWHCETDHGAMVLKVCNHDSIQVSSFWQGLNHLFAIDFPKHLGQTPFIANLIHQHGTIAAPTVVAAADNAFVLTQYLPGTDLDSHQISDAHIQLLGQHLGQLHQQSFKQWGALHAPNLASEHWPTRLHHTIHWLAEHSAFTVPSSILQKALAEALAVEERAFVPILPDLRWDQFRQDHQGNPTLIDLDAYVIGPSTLELVLMHYLLNPTQLALFKASYTRYQAWPDFSTKSTCYALLLFLLNVLGETDCQQWMQRFRPNPL